jgi:hypothetical protein
MRPHEIEKSAEIFSAQKIREVNFKQRRRKVDEERVKEPSYDISHLVKIYFNVTYSLENNEVEIYDDPQPQEPKTEYDYNEDSENYQNLHYQSNDEQSRSL